MVLVVGLTALVVSQSSVAAERRAARDEVGKVRFDLRLVHRYDNPNVVTYTVQGLGKRSGYRQEFQSYSELAGRRMSGFATMKKGGLYRLSSNTRECIALECPSPGDRSPRESELGPRIDKCAAVVRVRPTSDLRAEVRINPYDGCRFAVGQAR